MSRIDQLRQLLTDDPDDVFLNFGLAMELAQTGKTDEAIGQFDRVIQLDADYCAAHVQKAHLLIQANQRGQAKEAIEAGIAIARKAGDSHTVDTLTELLRSLTAG